MSFCRTDASHWTAGKRWTMLRADRCAFRAEAGVMAPWWPVTWHWDLVKERAEETGKTRQQMPQGGWLLAMPRNTQQYREHFALSTGCWGTCTTRRPSHQAGMPRSSRFFRRRGFPSFRFHLIECFWGAGMRCRDPWIYSQASLRFWILREKSLCLFSLFHAQESRAQKDSTPLHSLLLLPDRTLYLGGDDSHGHLDGSGHFFEMLIPSPGATTWSQRILGAGSLAAFNILCHFVGPPDVRRQGVSPVSVCG